MVTASTTPRHSKTFGKLPQFIFNIILFLYEIMLFGIPYAFRTFSQLLKQWCLKTPFKHDKWNVCLRQYANVFFSFTSLTTTHRMSLILLWCHSHSVFTGGFKISHRTCAWWIFDQDCHLSFCVVPDHAHRPASLNQIFSECRENLHLKECENGLLVVVYLRVLLKDVQTSHNSSDKLQTQLVTANQIPTMVNRTSFMLAIIVNRLGSNYILNTETNPLWLRDQLKRAASWCPGCFQNPVQESRALV